MSSLLLDGWSFTVGSAEWTTIFPDGCRDLILCQPRGAAPFIFATELDDIPRRVAVEPGDRFIGFRLQPGVGVKASLSRLAPRDSAEEVDWAVLQEALIECPQVRDALTALKHAASTSEAARRAGVSTRTLQRLVVTGTGRAPSWWRRLARVRRSAALLAATGAMQAELADAAIDAGFSDQAHMTREFRRWLGVTPGQVRRGVPFADVLRAKGYQ